MSSKKKRISKKSKKSWRKHTDIKDVDNFLDEIRLDERLGAPFSDRADHDIFVIDPVKTETKVAEKKRRAFQPPRCFEVLKPLTAVPDPISKRNHVRTKEERQHPARKRIIEQRRLKGIVQKKVLDSLRNRKATYLKKKEDKAKELEVKDDIWTEPFSELTDDMGWLKPDTVRHFLTNTRRLKVAPPKAVLVRPLLPSVENPHPGISYNPSYHDHQDLLKLVVDKEIGEMKKEEHLDRVTSMMFKRISPNQKDSDWMAEMSQGLKLGKEENEEEVPGNYTAINPPTRFDKKKTLKERRKIKEMRKAALELKRARIEKKKTADIYKLRFLNKEVKSKEEKSEALKEKRLKMQKVHELEPKRIGTQKYIERDLEFNRGHEIKGTLRGMKPEGSILADRFYSLQKRNILEPSKMQTKIKKAKKKRFQNPSYSSPSDKTEVEYMLQ